MIDNPAPIEPHRIDVHYHILPPRFLAVEQVHQPLMRAVTGVLGESEARQIIRGWTPAKALEELDRNGVAMGLCSMGSFGASLSDVAQGRRVGRVE